MAHSRKYSRLITVDGRQFRWHVDINDDYPWEKIVSVFPAEDPNGARLEMGFVTQAVLPSLVRRLILAGSRLGYDPDDASKSLIVRDEHALEVVHGYPRSISHSGVEYTWTPELRGGLHLKVRRTGAPDGQLLATFATLEPAHLNEELVSQVIDVALAEGWQPDVAGLDCHWIEEAVCLCIMNLPGNRLATCPH